MIKIGTEAEEEDGVEDGGWRAGGSGRGGVLAGHCCIRLWLVVSSSLSLIGVLGGSLLLGSLIAGGCSKSTSIYFLKTT